MSRPAGGVPRVLLLSCPDTDAEGFARLTALVTEFCPAVESVQLGVCAFTTGGPARYFGGEEALARKLAAAATAAGFRCRIGVADGLFAALIAARAPVAGGSAANGPGAGAGAGGTDRAGDTLDAITVVPAGGTARFLAGQPVSVLDDADLAGLLARLGIRTLGDLAALPVDTVASRFGEAGEAAHRQARGEQPRPLAVRAPPGDLAVTAEFDPPEPLAEPVVFAAKALAERLHAALAARGVTCVRVEVQATWEDGSQDGRLWRHDGLLTAVQVADRVRWQLDGARSTKPADNSKNGPRALDNSKSGRGADDNSKSGPRADDNSKNWPRVDDNSKNTGGIVELRLVPDQLVRATGRQLSLWGEAVVTDKVARAAMRVQALLGHDAVLRPVRSGGRNVRDQMELLPFGADQVPKLAADRPWPGRIPGPAPAVVFPEPRAARVTDPAGEPVSVSGRCVVSGPPADLSVDGEPARTVTGWAGPWPLAERWWDPAQASRVARFQLVTDDGRAWLAVVRDGAWEVEAGYW